MSLNFNLNITPINPASHPGYKLASSETFNEHGYLQVSTQGFQFFIHNPNPFAITVNGDYHLASLVPTNPPFQIPQLTQLPPQATSDEGMYLQQNGLMTVSPSYYDHPIPTMTIGPGGFAGLVPTPEPSTIIGLGTGLGLLMVWRSIGVGLRRRGWVA
jgi:hypothetical protein